MPGHTRIDIIQLLGVWRVWCLALGRVDWSSEAVVVEDDLMIIWWLFDDIAQGTCPNMSKIAVHLHIYLDHSRCISVYNASFWCIMNSITYRRKWASGSCHLLLVKAVYIDLTLDMTFVSHCYSYQLNWIHWILFTLQIFLLLLLGGSSHLVSGL